MPKPFSIQSPEAIAKEYGGNKQKIAQAMQMGLVDPTAGTLAGMFIDRMRGAQMQEGAQQPSVAQQVFAPPAPPAPMGAPPMGGMPPGAPPMGAPPMGGMPPGAPPMGAPPMGMADGGLAALPISESMFDEPMDGEYAGGGIVSFAAGDEVDYNKILQNQLAYYNDPEQMKADFYGNYQPKREASERFRQYYANALSPEARKKLVGDDLAFAGLDIASSLLTTPGGPLLGIGKGIEKATPRLRESAKERRAEERDAIKQLALDEGATNAESRELSKMFMDGRLKGTDIAQTLAQLRSREDLTREEIKSREKISDAEVAAQRTIAGMKQPNESFDETALRILMMDPSKPGVAAAQKAVEKIFEMKKPPSFMPGFEGGGAGKPAVTVAWPSPKK